MKKIKLNPGPKDLILKTLWREVGDYNLAEHSIFMFSEDNHAFFVAIRDVIGFWLNVDGVPEDAIGVAIDSFKGTLVNFKLQEGRLSPMQNLSITATINVIPDKYGLIDAILPKTQDGDLIGLELDSVNRMTIKSILQVHGLLSDDVLTIDWQIDYAIKSMTILISQLLISEVVLQLYDYTLKCSHDGNVFTLKILSEESDDIVISSNMDWWRELIPYQTIQSMVNEAKSLTRA